ncbi:MULTISPECIES: hypothetical protein [Rhizobium]|uniref:hypothetical protein n=1 Tax=Rhizobium TaxID=379 RepID=UPI00235F3328|nr:MULTISPECIES: hypothetical protein [unclassified Rhizobium]MDC9810949.1 hypothetical protein [Rhizobium sp. MC62]MDC9836242.1 hypothetical protein [Rhizobium sp. MJ37]WEA24633.1 hypothetical protein PO862_16295 [Rhizobium sp. MJ22]WEA59144.1 hypothetical protein PO860_15880 [Rhizobium sp. BJ04]
MSFSPGCEPNRLHLFLVLWFPVSENLIGRMHTGFVENVKTKRIYSVKFLPEQAKVAHFEPKSTENQQGRAYFQSETATELTIRRCYGDSLRCLLRKLFHRSGRWRKFKPQAGLLLRIPFHQQMPHLRLTRLKAYGSILNGVIGDAERDGKHHIKYLW